MIAAQQVHFIGIGGIGMSGLAKVLLESGISISGSDLAPSELARRLGERGATIHTGHRPENLGQAELVVASSAIPADNPELLEAAHRQLPIIKRAELLGQLMARRQGIAVAGTHGKTTTAALIAYLLKQAGLDPTFVVGGEVINLGGNAALGQGPHLVAEADEFDASFLKLHPYLAVVTNIEAEHLDYYGSFDAEVEAFYQFLNQVAPEGHIIASADDPALTQLLKRQLSTAHLHRYGLAEGAPWQARQLRPDGQGGRHFSLCHGGTDLGPFHITLPGRHNLSNAIAAIIAAHLLGLDLEGVRQALPAFQGVRRRFEVRGEVGGITIVDDYAHHPTEIRATLSAAKDRYPGRRLVTVFQPHLYSRTKHLLDDFAACFQDADEVIITDIYPSRERDDLGISSRDLADALSHPRGSYGGNLRAATERSIGLLRPGDVLLALGAGDITKLSQGVLEALSP